MPDPMAAFLAGLLAVSLAAAGLCVVAYTILTRKKRMRHRVEFLVPAHQSRSHHNPVAVAPAQLVAAGLHGDDLELARRLEWLQIPPTLAPRLLLALRTLAGVALAAALPFGGYRYLNLSGMPSFAGLAALGAAAGWALPQIVLERLALHRRRAVARGLADAIELLVISVEAGLSLEEALNRITVELHRTQPATAEELALTSADLRILPSRDEALWRMAERIDLPSVRSVVTTLSQTLKYGTPLAQALRVVAVDLRNNDLLKLEEQVNRLPVLLTVPMILFILPSIFLIIGGPAVLKILDVLANMH
jgi:tight adherence protein C